MEKLDVLQGTLDLMVLQTLETMGSLHGYGIARRIEQVSDDAVAATACARYVRERRVDDVPTLVDADNGGAECRQMPRRRSADAASRDAADQDHPAGEIEGEWPGRRHHEVRLMPPSTIKVCPTM